MFSTIIEYESWEQANFLQQNKANTIILVKVMKAITTYPLCYNHVKNQGKESTCPSFTVPTTVTQQILNTMQIDLPKSGAIQLKITWLPIARTFKV